MPDKNRLQKLKRKLQKESRSNEPLAKNIRVDKSDHEPQNLNNSDEFENIPSIEAPNVINNAIDPNKPFSDENGIEVLNDHHEFIEPQNLVN